ncbi:flavin-containing monooxygenase [Pseudomonas chlororaphis]|uniref:flavin-containing monooxygenase n=1 Tax=Pseudomonas chlororaphis TaxID=587753 RepID=UPI000F570C96|nr:NAD(P)/FAD-dependent oxidoreductase [Pseudomonas chlororaphis]AZD75399.1 Cyclohexanone monooxygenase [Pseudomonas chlororaphis subsp. aurantiaca]
MSALLQEQADPARVYRVLIIGAGFSGIGMAINLRQRGEQDFLILEQEAGVGGTWWVNQYPGCACDIPSHLYSFSFEPNPDWSRRYSPQPEIRDYLRHCADKYQVLQHCCFNTAVTGLRWLEERALWQVTDARGGVRFAQVVVAGTGALSTPDYPQLPGLERFKGRVFHSQQWDHEYALAGKRVGVIGTGASAIQFVPQIQPQVASLAVFQRTPPWIIPKPDRAFSTTGQRLLRRFPAVQRLLRGLIYTAHETRVFGFVFNPRLMALHKWLALNLLRRQVKDPELRRRLTPDYAIGCKRILLSNDYFPALAQANTRLVTSGIREVTEDALITVDGQRHALDALIFGTGFKARTPFPAGMILGRGGVDIVDTWQQGSEAYKGTTVSGFPNLFLLMGPNTGLGHNSIVYMIESQIAYILGALDTLQRLGVTSVDVDPQAQARFNQGLRHRLRGAVWSVGSCQSWYVDPHSGRNVALWPGFSWQFRQQTRYFDAEAYRLTSHPQGVKP